MNNETAIKGGNLKHLCVSFQPGQHFFKCKRHDRVSQERKLLNYLFGRWNEMFTRF